MNHLAYYRAQGISPVHYQGTQQEHFERRSSLYRSLRLTELAFRSSRVLEVAAGTGQNAQWISSCHPRQLVLIEPNDARVVCGREYLLPIRLEDYEPKAPFDIVICENWLGTRELDLLHKLAGFVDKGGVLVLTCVHPLGMMANLLRRELAKRLINDSMSFEQKTETLVRAFGPHLATIRHMTRSPEDWAQDWLLNPAVEHIGLTFPMLIEQIGRWFDILGTSPEFSTDWRWFKSLHGEHRGFNEHALRAYLDSESERRFMNYLDEPSDLARSEAREMISRTEISPEDVAGMEHFGRWFGRETIYTSWQRVR